MSHTERKTLLATLMASLLAFCGCGKSKDPSRAASSEPTIVEEIRISGFDPEGEPVVKKWSDGTIWLHFEAMPPFFAEAQGKETEFENFEQQMEKALKVPVTRLDREIFVIKEPSADTAEKAKKWLENFKNPR